MKIFGIEVFKPKAQTMNSVDTRSGSGWFNVILESFTGAWQQHVAVDTAKDVLAYSGPFACTTKIANDIGKLYPMLVQDNPDGTCTEVEGQSPYRVVLEKPNHFQTRITFFKQWLASKLIFGNTYVLKERDARGLVRRLYILDAQRVTPLVTEDGDVYYRLVADHLAGLKQDSIVVPASEIIHDLNTPLWHPLVGVSPLYACGMSATMGNRIQRNSTKFFQNMSRPGGALVAPGKIDDEDAKELKRQWDENFGGANSGRTAVLGNGLKYEPMAINAQDAQLIEQLKWTIEDIARCYHMPSYKVGGQIPQNTSVEVLNQQYYSECLQILIEDIELCLKEGLALPIGYYVQFDLDGLLRMDNSALVKSEAEAVKGMIKAPNEARLRLNLPPAKGGEAPLAQQQNYSLEALAKRDALPDPFATKGPSAAPPLAQVFDFNAARMRAALRRKAA